MNRTGSIPSCAGGWHCATRPGAGTTDTRAFSLRPQAADARICRCRAGNSHQLAELAAGRFSQSELETARTGLLSDLRLLCDSPGRLDEFYTGRAAEGISQSPAELAAALCAVTAEDVCAAARRVRPDAVYTLEEA